MTKNKLHTAIKYFIVFTIGTLIGLGSWYFATTTTKSEEPIIYEIPQKDIDLALESGYVDSKRGFFYHYPDTKEYIKKTTFYNYYSCDRVTVDVRNTGEKLYIYGKYNFLSETAYYLENINVTAGTSLYFHSQVDISKYITCEYEEVRD
jgi:hypothetical protein